MKVILKCNITCNITTFLNIVMLVAENPGPLGAAVTGDGAAPATPKEQ